MVLTVLFGLVLEARSSFPSKRDVLAGQGTACAKGFCTRDDGRHVGPAMGRDLALSSRVVLVVGAGGSSGHVRSQSDVRWGQASHGPAECRVGVGTRSEWWETLMENSGPGSASEAGSEGDTG